MRSDDSTRTAWVAYIHDLQDRICAALEQADGVSSFKEDAWQRDGGGGGRTRVIAGDGVFEKGGVNISEVHGEVTPVMRAQLGIDGHAWWACGLSLVLHPRNPFVPTVHCNYRMFQLYAANGDRLDRWYGGGADLTPYYLFTEDAQHFHRTHKEACDATGAELYPRYKAECDAYFVNHHRNSERRGIGGIFFDHLRADPTYDDAALNAFARACGDAFNTAYVPIVERRRDAPYTAQHKHWQEIRRGRYTEFNLVHDRGTLFGLRTNGRTESILMSLPPTVRFEYDHRPEPNGPEADLLDACLHPRTWA